MDKHNWRNSDIWFNVSLIAPRGGVVVTRSERGSLRRNATKIPHQDRWLFEGEWTTVVSDDRFKCIGEGSVPCLGGRSTKVLQEIVSECIGARFVPRPSEESNHE